MPMSYQAGEFNSFVGGLVTEASPLTFPENASIDEVNFILNHNGSRRRRLGMDVEDGVGTFLHSTLTDDSKVSIFEWENPGNQTGKVFTALQLDAVVYVLDRGDETLKSSAYKKGSWVIPASGESLQTTRASFAAVDGKLIVAAGCESILVIEYKSQTDTFTTKHIRLKIRDLFGVPQYIGNDDLIRGVGISRRPTQTELDNEGNDTLHVYNLRNQGWHSPRQKWSTNDEMIDPLFRFLTASGDYFPSNADIPHKFYYPNTAQAAKDVERFDEDSSVDTPPDSTPAPKGHFIIDLLSRSDSREEAYAAEVSTKVAEFGYTALVPSINLPPDYTEGGARVVAEFAGRAFYGGFNTPNNDISLSVGELYDNSTSPSLGSYVVYSQLVKDVAHLDKCYQDGDPTSPESPDILDTDGGFLRISECFNIQAMVSLGSALMVVAQNGVWAIEGADSSNFTANSQKVTKITEHGTKSPQSVVLVDGTLMYWSDDAIYHLHKDQVGDWTATELSVNIRRFYQDIQALVGLTCRGVYDTYDRKVRWLYDNRLDGDGSAKELVFDVKLGAFYPANINASPAANKPYVLTPVLIPPYNVGLRDLNVAAGTDNVVAGVDNVVAEVPLIIPEIREVAYLTYTPTTGNVSWASYNNTSFLDWESIDSIGVDASAYLVTGYLGTGEHMRFKQVPYIYFHFLRTETGFTDNGTDLTPVGESSCLVQAQWEWTDSAAYGKWGKQFQAYRYKRAYFPSGVSDEFDYGTKTIVTKNKLRGRGRVLSLKLETEAGKDLQLFGWGMAIGTNGGF